MIENAFHHDQCRIDDDPEIDRAQGNEVRRLAVHHHDAEGKQERDGHSERHDQGKKMYRMIETSTTPAIKISTTVSIVVWISWVRS